MTRLSLPVTVGEDGTRKPRDWGVVSSYPSTGVVSGVYGRRKDEEVRPRGVGRPVSVRGGTSE